MRVLPTAVPAVPHPCREFSYILGDSKPLDPEKGWDKNLGLSQGEPGPRYVEYYPTGTAVTLKEFAQGQRWIISRHHGMGHEAAGAKRDPRTQNSRDLDHGGTPRSLSMVVIIGQFRWACRRGSRGRRDPRPDQVHAERRSSNELTWPAFIGPSIKAATLDKAPKDIQDQVREFWRPEYDQIGTKWKTTPTLAVKQLSYAMDRWDREIGADQVKK